jgi:putative cardiolipin synthase
LKKTKLIYRLIAGILFISLGACATAKLPDNTGRSESFVYEDTQETALSRSFERQSKGHAGESGFHYLANGLDAFVARAALAEVAERSIDTQYYMIHNDEVGSLFIDQLYKAAERGVRVRLLIDDIDQGGRDSGLAILDAHPKIEVRIFNPFARNVGRTGQYITGFGKQTRRAHNKSFTVDNQVTILGGRNIGNEYFNADPELAFLDMDVLSTGPVAQEVSASFDLYWNHDLSYPITTLAEELPSEEEARQRKQEFDAFIAEQYESAYVQHLRDSDLAEDLIQGYSDLSWGIGDVVADDPDKLTVDTSDTKYRLIEQMRPYLEGVQKELIIFSPYFVPGKGGVAYFQTLRDRGVRVRILTNSLSSTDVSAVHAGYARYRKALLRMGVELHELNKDLSKEERKKMKEGGIGDSRASLHAKAFVIDREWVFIGSLNLDPRSIVQNTEIGVVFQSPEIAKLIADGFDSKIDKLAFRLTLEDADKGNEQIVWHGLVGGEQKTLYKDPYTSFWKRFGVGFMRILPIESQI